MDSVFYIEIGGSDVTGNFTKETTSISVTDGSGETADSASIDVNNTDGAIALPTRGDEVKIGLGRTEAVLVFEGTIEKVTSSGSRGSGRTIAISAKSVDVGNGKAKKPSQKHKDRAKLGDVMKEWGADAGVPEVHVHKDLADIERPYWSMNGENFMAWGRRTARSVGATFKIMGKRVVMVPRSAGVSADGGTLSKVYAKFGENLISWSLDTAKGRPEHGKFKTRRYDEGKAEWKTEEEDPEYETDAEADDYARFSEADEGGAKHRSKSRAKESDRDRGGGTIDIDGDPMAQSEGTVTLSGAGEGVDGDWLIDSVTHTRSRGGGYTTSLSVKRPGEGVGKDKRASDGKGEKATKAGRSPASSSESIAPASTPATTPPATGGSHTGGIGHA